MLLTESLWAEIWKWLVLPVPPGLLSGPGVTPHPWLTRPVPTLDADPAQAAELLTLAQERRTVLTEDVIQLLRDALRPVPGSR